MDYPPGYKLLSSEKTKDGPTNVINAHWDTPVGPKWTSVRVEAHTTVEQAVPAMVEDLIRYVDQKIMGAA